MIKLLLPVRDILVTQPFGTSFTWYDPKKGKYVDFYQNLGFKGHMGIDFLANDGCMIRATHTGKVNKAYFNNGAGNYVEIIDESGEFATGYCHLKNFNVKVGDKIIMGKKIGEADNTGVYTTGSHLHFEIKLLDKNFNVLNKDNGYGGCVDPSQYFANQYGDKWFKPACYHRYGIKQDWLAEFNMRFKNVWLHRQLKKIGRLNLVNDTNTINKLVYGGWSLEEAINPAMNYVADHLKKDDLKRGIKPFE
jgi:murein DD-endopeptidase MepM/ murein hydrolase activator NlpD